MCLQDILDSKKQQLNFQYAAENKFKRDFINEWITCFGKSGDIVSGYREIDPKHGGGSRQNSFYSDPLHHLMFETIGLSFRDVEELWSNDAVEKLWFGLKTDWSVKRNDLGYKTWSFTEDRDTPTFASINGDEDLFKHILQQMNNDYGNIDSINFKYAKEGFSENEDEQTAIDDAKINAYNNPLTGKKIGVINVCNGTTCINTPTSDADIIIDSTTKYDHLDGTSTAGSARKYDVDVTTKTVKIYDDYWESWTSVKVYEANVTVYYNVETTFSTRQLFDINNFYDILKSTWNSYRVVYWENCEDDHGTGTGCYTDSYNIYDSKLIFTKIVRYLEAQVDWLSRGSREHYNIIYSRYMKARAIEIIGVLNQALNIWIEEDDGGFWGSSWGQFFKVILFGVAVVAMVFLFEILVVGELLGGMLGFSASTTGMIAFFIGSTAISYTVGMVTRDANMFKYLMFAGGIVSLAGGLALAEQSIAERLASGKLTAEGAALATANNAQTGALKAVLNMTSLFYIADAALDMTGEYHDDIDAEDKERALLFMDDTCDSMFYYNYDKQPAFADGNFSYDTIA